MKRATSILFQMESLTKDVQDVFRDLVLNGDWLSNATKQLAEVKINNIVHNIGYPDDIIDEDKLREEVEGVINLEILYVQGGTETMNQIFN